MSDLNDWIYIYFIKNGVLYYDRTTSRNGSIGLMRAKQIVAEHESRGYESFYTIGTLTKAAALS